jgi:GDPmannose 4,6-dehydratase
MKKALVIGASGMDGSLMSELLLAEGYKVWGTYLNDKRWAGNIKHDNFHLFQFDLCKTETMMKEIVSIAPHEIYNFGGVTFSPDSEHLPQYTMEVNYDAVCKLIEICLIENIKLFQASSSEIFGNIKNKEIDENTTRNPHTPYAQAKNQVDMLMRFHRQQGAKFYTAISFNHECERRGSRFVTQKICSHVKAILNDDAHTLKLGNIQSRRDWGNARDFVKGFYMQMQGEPSELVFATGKTHSVEDLLNFAFEPYEMNWREYVTFDTDLFRVDERNNIYGNYSKAEKLLGWQPKTELKDLIYGMTK